MNYEQISKMTFAELRALEYDLNRVKCERGSIFNAEFYTDEDRKKKNIYLLLMPNTTKKIKRSGKQSCVKENF